MVKNISSWWSKLYFMLEEWAERRHPWSEVLAVDDALDKKEIERAERAIVNHLYLRHLAKASLRAREEWRQQMPSFQNYDTLMSIPDKSADPLKISQGSS